MNKRDFVQKAALGDKDAYSALIDAYQGMVFAVALNITRDYTESEDIVQEAFLCAWENLSSLSDPLKFGSWLYTLTKRLALKFLQKKGRITASLDENLDIEQIEDYAESPADSAAQKEINALLWQQVNILPAKIREAILLYYMEEFSTARAAEFLGIEEAAFRMRLKLGREKLRSSLMEKIEGELRRRQPREKTRNAILAALPTLKGDSSIAEKSQLNTSPKGEQRSLGKSRTHWTFHLVHSLSSHYVIPFAAVILVILIIWFSFHRGILRFSPGNSRHSISAQEGANDWKEGNEGPAIISSHSLNNDAPDTGDKNSSRTLSVFNTIPNEATTCISGIVVDQSNQPVEGAQLFFIREVETTCKQFWLSDEFGSPSDILFRVPGNPPRVYDIELFQGVVQTSSDGRFSFSGLKPGQTYSIGCDVPSYGKMVVENLVPTGESPSKYVVIRFVKGTGTTVSGRVLLNPGRTLDQVIVVASNYGTKIEDPLNTDLLYDASIVTNENGEFTFYNVPLGILFVRTVFIHGGPLKINVLSQDPVQNAEIVIYRKVYDSFISGCIVDKDKKPLAGGFIIVPLRRNLKADDTVGMVGRNGRFSIPRVPGDTAIDLFYKMNLQSSLLRTDAINITAPTRNLIVTCLGSEYDK